MNAECGIVGLPLLWEEGGGGSSQGKCTGIRWGLSGA